MLRISTINNHTYTSPRPPGGQIHDAALDAIPGTLRERLELGDSPNVVGPVKDWRPLHYLLREGDKMEARLTCLLILLEAGADIDAPDVDDMTPLDHAAESCHVNVVAALLEAGADVNRGGEYNVTPLHHACERHFDSDVAPARVLIRNGATVDARDRWGQAPLDYAIRHLQVKSRRRRHILPILLRAGAALPAESDDAYIRKVILAGNIGRYERIHLNDLGAIFVPKFAHLLPPEMVRRVVEYAFHVGDY